VARSFLKLESASLTLGDVYHRAAAVRRLPQRIRARYPGIEVSLIESTPPRLSQLLLNGTLEACARKVPPHRQSTVAVEDAACEPSTGR
jgi:DNA-binding transcriptional LysR family regulator